MPRPPRFVLPGVPQHILQRGNNRQPIFLSDGDFIVYLEHLRMAANKHGCRVHAYVLMSNHVHLLATPARLDSIAKTMQALGRRYVQYFNRRYARTGTMWEGRYKACLIETQRYLLNCYRYIENNPVRAGIVRAPKLYEYSSYGYHALGRQDPVLDAHSLYTNLGATPEERQRCYRDFVAAGSMSEVEEIRRATNGGRVLGTTSFRRHAQVWLGRCVEPGKPGRPPIAAAGADYSLAGPE